MISQPGLCGPMIQHGVLSPYHGIQRQETQLGPDGLAVVQDAVGSELALSDVKDASKEGDNVLTVQPPEDVPR